MQLTSAWAKKKRAGVSELATNRRFQWRGEQAKTNQTSKQTTIKHNPDKNKPTQLKKLHDSHQSIRQPALSIEEQVSSKNQKNAVNFFFALQLQQVITVGNVKG